MKKSKGLKCKGAVLIMSMIFVVLFSALAVSMATLSMTNLIVAQNQCKSDAARACAESGLEVIRYWMSRASISGTTLPSERFNQIAASIQSEMADAAANSGILLLKVVLHSYYNPRACSTVVCLGI